MRKATKRRNRIEAKIPMMVVMHGIPDLSLTERLSVEAFAGGWANADCRNIMTLAAAERDDKQTLAICELALVALSSIKDRYARTGKFGGTGEEIQALRVLADVSEDFWKRQSGATFARHYSALKRLNMGAPKP